MKNKIIYAFGVLLLVGSFALSQGSARTLTSDPIPPCSPSGCPTPGLN